MSGICELGTGKKGFQYLRGLTISFFTVCLSSFVFGNSESRHPPPRELKLDQLSDPWRVLNCFWYSGIGWNVLTFYLFEFLELMLPGNVVIR